MAEQFASGQMFHLHDKARVAPLNIIRPQVLELVPRGRERSISAEVAAPRGSCARPRSICHRRTELVWPRGSLKEAELDQEPDRADDRDKHNQHPPAGFVTVMEALDMDDDRGG
jgi:hypothetical protein